MKKLIKFVIVCAILLFVASHFFGFDVKNAFVSAKTLAIDTVEKIIPGSASQFEDIDSQISSRIVQSGVSQNLAASAKIALEKASFFLNKFWIGLKNFAQSKGINLNFSLPYKKHYSGGAGYSFEYANMDMSKATELRQQFINYCMTLRGTPYVWGRESPEEGFDCSSFVRYAAKNSIHIQLPRTAVEQYQVVQPVSSSEREPGDLVFFRKFGRIDHVGIYLGRYEGSGSLKGREIFINSASEGPRTGVVVSALDEPYWRRHYSSSGRFLPSYKMLAEEM